jgi:hypothetical protein
LQGERRRKICLAQGIGQVWRRERIKSSAFVLVNERVA